MNSFNSVFGYEGLTLTLVRGASNMGRKARVSEFWQE